jgi:hypothetical protein
VIRKAPFPILLVLIALGCGGEDKDPAMEATGGGGSSAGANASGSSGSLNVGGGGAGGNSGGSGGGLATLGPPFVATRLASKRGGNCVITKSQQLACWGNGVPTASDLKYTQVSGQFDQLCAILDDSDALETGNVWCFTASMLNTSTPAGLFEEVRVSEHSACARNAENLLTCWTDGDADAAPIATGTPKAAVKNFYLMGDTACAVMQTGAVQCWGRDLAEGPRLVPARQDYLVLGGYRWLFGIAPDGSISGWGLGDVQPSVPRGKDFVQIAGGEDHLAALQSNGLVSSVGTDAATAPMGVEFVEISAGDGQTCGITKAGSVACWGDGSGPEFKAPPDAVQVF